MKEKRRQLKKIAARIIYLLIIMTGSIFPGSSTFRFKHTSLDQGLSQNSVYCMLQDSKGFMWFGTQDGLNKYDGYTFTVYKPRPCDSSSLSHNMIQAICEDNRGMLWIGTRGGGLNRFDPVKEKFCRYPADPGNPNRINSGFITVLYAERSATAGSSGTVWVGTAGGGLSKITPGKTREEKGTIVTYLKKPDTPGKKGSNFIGSILEDSSGIFWVVTLAGLDKFDKKTGKFIHYLDNADLPGSRGNTKINKILEDRLGNLWLSTNTGLFSLEKKTGKFTCYRHKPGDSTGLSSNNITTIIEDRSGVLWIGTYSGGLNRFNRKSGTFTHYRHDVNDPYSISQDDIYSLYEDRSRILWIGTPGRGLNRLDPRNSFEHYLAHTKDDNGLEDNFVFAVHEDRSAALWIATYAGGLKKYDRKTGHITHFRHIPGDPNSLSTNRLRCLYEDRSGSLWIGTLGAGLDKFDRRTGKFSHYPSSAGDPNSLGSSLVHSIFEDSSGTLWIGTNGGGLTKFNRETGTFTRYRSRANDPNSLSHNTIDVIYEAPSEPGILWIGTRNGGLNRFDTGKEYFTRWKETPGDSRSLSNNKVMAVLEDSSGALWVGTHGGGLNKAIDRKGGNVKFVHYTEKDGLSNNSIYGILEDSSGNLWLSTNLGISKFDPRSETFKNYDVRDGLQGNEFNHGACYKSRSGEMFFGGINGFNAFYPREIKDNPHIPPIVITGFQIANKPVEIGTGSLLPRSVTYCERVELPYKQNVFSFEFAALDYTIPGKNRYAYKMEGLDEDWLYTGARQRSATYTYLSPGKYTFRVKGSNNDGTWNEQGTSVYLVILPPFYLTWWFKAIALICLAGIIYALCKKRVNYVSLKLKEEIAYRDLLLRYDISKREKEIVDLILKGKGSKDIEDELYISYHTVKNHLYNIYKKFKVSTRGELILFIKTSTNSFHPSPVPAKPVPVLDRHKKEAYSIASER